MARRLLVLNLLALALSGGACPHESAFTVGNLELVSSQSTTGLEVHSEQVGRQRVDRTNFLFTYRPTLENGGTSAARVVATVASTSPHTAVLDRRVSFDDVVANRSTPANDTFTIRHDRSFQFDPDSLVWSFESDPIENRCQDVTDVQLEDAVQDAATQLETNGVQVVASAWADPVVSELLLSSVEQLLSCEITEDPITATTASQLSIQAAPTGGSFVPSIDYCGPGFLIEGGITGAGGPINLRGSACINQACHSHDECYAENCIRGQCAFSFAGAAQQCDLDFLTNVETCFITDSATQDSFTAKVVRELAILYSARIDSSDESACAMDADSCDGGVMCREEVCDGVDNDCNGYVDDTVNLTGAWSGSWAAFDGSIGGALSADLLQPRLKSDLLGAATPALVAGRLGISGSDLVSGGTVSGTLACEDVNIGGTAGIVFGLDIVGAFSGSFGTCSGSGTYAVSVQGADLGEEGVWNLDRTCQ